MQIPLHPPSPTPTSCKGFESVLFSAQKPNTCLQQLATGLDRTGLLKQLATGLAPRGKTRDSEMQRADWRD